MRLAPGIASRVQRLAAIFIDDASAWGLGWRTAAAIAILPVVVGALVALAHLIRPLYRFLTAEDSLLEWIQVACVALTFVLLLQTARLLARRREWAWVVVFGLGAAASVAIVGEEISWGQRLIGVTTPDILQDVNTQSETNLHNVRGVLPALNFITMVGAGVLASLPIAVAVARHLGRTIWPVSYRIVPPLALVPAFAIPFAYRAMRFVSAGGTSGSYAEFVELSLYFGILVFAALLRRRIRKESSAV
jgi:hypothetical protein